jgi:hypothetical protein
MATNAASLRSAKGGLRQYLANKLLARKASTAAPGAADPQQIGAMIKWWMKHDPLDASRRIVDAVGLGGAYHLPAGERLRLARAFLAMLDIDATFEGDQTAVREPTSPRHSRSTSSGQTSGGVADESPAVASTD